MIPIQGPRFLPEGGDFEGPFTVRIIIPETTSTTEVILYTTDGTIPRLGSSICQKALTIRP